MEIHRDSVPLRVDDTRPGKFTPRLGMAALAVILAVLAINLPWTSSLALATQPPASDLVILIDDSLSMGEADIYPDAATLERAVKLGEGIRKQLRQDLLLKIRALEKELEVKVAAAAKNPDAKAAVDAIRQRLQYWQKQQEQIVTNKWRPSRLQLAQAILSQQEPNWLKTLATRHQANIHVFHLDIEGRAVKLRDADGDAGDISPADPKGIPRAVRAIAQLEPIAKESRLGTAIRQVIDKYRGSALSSVILFTDGVTTRDETIAEAAEYAAQKGVSLYLVGLGSDQQRAELKLYDLRVEDTIYLGDRAEFSVRLTSQGYKDLTVPVVLKIQEKGGQDKELQRQMVKVDPAGKAVLLKFAETPKKAGRHRYIIEVEPPKLEATAAPLPAANLRLEQTIEVIEGKPIKVLYVEGQPRYEFRFVKALLERQSFIEKKNKSLDFKVLLLDADADFAVQDRSALASFPASLEELNKYDVLILGDCDPNHKKWKDHLKNIAAFVRGEDEKGEKAAKPGGGLLFLAGPAHNPHRYKDTPLAALLPVEPNKDVPKEEPRVDRLRPELTPLGRLHPIFRFHPDDQENAAIWQRLTPMYWYSTGYRIKPLAEVLAVHPTEKAAGTAGRHPLVVQQFVGTGRSMFFGFDETWRWRFRADEPIFNQFWLQTVRYLARTRPARTELRLDRQPPYLVGEPLKLTVRFPHDMKLDQKTEVKVAVSYAPAAAGKNEEDPEINLLRLAKVEGSSGVYEGVWPQTRAGKYRFRLISPEVATTQPNGERPSVEAVVELPPGELSQVRMNAPEMIQAAKATQGGFFTIVNADEVLEKLPAAK